MSAKGAGIVPHHHFPLGLRHFILPQVKRLTDVDCADRLLVEVPVAGSHRERTGRDQHELHPEAIREAWREPCALALCGYGNAIQRDGCDNQHTDSHQSHTRYHDMLGKM
jgi:hypothetical protein